MKNIFIAANFFLSCSLSAQLSVTTNSSAANAANLVNNVLLGPGVMASNVQFTGSWRALGSFSGINSNIGLGSGVILSTGHATAAVGPNNTTSKSGQNMQPGDPVLTQIAGQPTADAAILEFDFVPSSDSIRFRYVFASEEYYEGVCTPYNDVFAFLINGPGITGTANIALIPGTNKPVSISSVNGGILGESIYSPSTSYTYCNLSYTNFYIDNVNPLGLTVQYDGFTKVFTAKAKVIPCQTYHIRLAIADGGNDNTWDSGVFLEAGSFNSHYLTVSNTPHYLACTTNSAAVEGTGKAVLSFKRYDSIPYPRSLDYTLSGSAALTDYAVSSPKITFAPGSDSTVLIITPLTDNLPEGIETVSVTIIPDFIVCNGWTIPGGQVNITDPPALNPDFVTTLQDGCAPFCTQFTNISSGTTTASWTFGDSSPSVQSPAVTHCYTEDGLYDVKLSITDHLGCKDSITKTSYITVYAKPLADFVQKNEYISLHDNVGIFKNSSLNAIQFDWSLNGIYLSSSTDLEYQFRDTGCYNLQLVATNEKACKDTTNMNVCVTEGFAFWMPNSFSPDKDGINDVLFPKGTGWQSSEYAFEIYDRWGTQVFRTEDKNSSWDGQIGGSKCTDDVYTWKVHLKDIYLKAHDFRGHVLILR